jgi:hypothetical protein
MNTRVKQIKNENGTFTYLVNDIIHTKESKKDYIYFLDEVGSFSNSIKSITLTKNYWFKYGNSNVNKNKLNIIEIEK